MRYGNCGETRVSLYLALAIPLQNVPGKSRKLLETLFKKTPSHCLRTSTVQLAAIFRSQISVSNSTCKYRFDGCLAPRCVTQQASSKEAAMCFVEICRCQSLRRSPLKRARWMSPTSHLARDPFGAAVARSPHPASGGGGEGSIPLVSPSELGRQWWLWRREAWSAGSRWRLPGSLARICEAGENALVRRAGIIARISVSPQAPAIKSMMNSAESWVPWITGLPVSNAGSRVMRGSSAAMPRLLRRVARVVA